MATPQIVDDRDDEKDDKNQEPNSADTSDNEQAGSLDDLAIEGQEEDNDDSNDNELPEKYRGKSIEDIVRMHQEAERVLGQQGNEVGELRQVVDNFINSEIQSREQEQSTEEPVDFFTEPEKAIAQAINNHPLIKKVIETTESTDKRNKITDIQRKFPNIQQDLQDPAFLNWMKGSNLRQKLFVRANNEHDFDACEELFSMWEERKALVAQTQETEKTSRKQTIKGANTGSQAGSSATGSKKIYKRVDIIKLMQNDPDRYQALEPQIRQAYAEGRVR